MCEIPGAVGQVEGTSWFQENAENSTFGQFKTEYVVKTKDIHMTARTRGAHG